LVPEIHIVVFTYRDHWTHLNTGVQQQIPISRKIAKPYLATAKLLSSEHI